MSSENNRLRGARAVLLRFKEVLPFIDHSNAEEDEEDGIKLKKIDPAIIFIKGRFTARPCDSFAPRRTDLRKFSKAIHPDGHAEEPAAAEQICECGYAKGEHEHGPEAAGALIASFSHSTAKSAAIRAPSMHAPSTQMPLVTTNAYGKITFQPCHMVYRKAAKYVRLSNESHMNDVLRLMKDYWGLVKKLGKPDANPNVNPDVILSVVGGGRRFRLSDSRKKAIFDQGLIKVVTMTNGWILSQGTNNGVSKAVGDAVREGQSLQYDENGEITRTIHCIGITPWHIIKGREELINEDPNKFAEAEYRVHQFNEPNLYNLNPDHSHFLFVDGGDNEEGKKNIDLFHASLQKQLHTVCPVLCLLIDGGIKTFTLIRYTLEKGTHVLICKGTGRFADILAEAVTLFKIMKPRSPVDEIFRNQLSFEVQENLDYIASTNDINKDDLFNQIVDVVFGHSNRLLVFDTDKDALDVTIMGFLLDQKHQNQSVASQLQLVLRWNASAIAASKIFPNPAFTQIGDNKLAEFLETALINDQVEFVKLFTDYGTLNGDIFLSVERLRKLYVKTLQCRESLSISLVMKKMNIKVEVEKIRLCHIHTIIKKFTRLYDDQLYSNDTPVCPPLNANEIIFKYPFRELFIWAVLFNRQSLALFFWENCFKPLPIALLGCLLCAGMKRQMKSLADPMAAEYNILKGKLQQLAVGIVDQAFVVDREKAMLMVQLPIESIGGLDSLAIAGIARAPAYFNANCCQQVIDEQWKRGFDANGGRIVLSAYVPPLLYALIRFHENQVKLTHQVQSHGYSQNEDVVWSVTNTIGDGNAVMARRKSINSKISTIDQPGPIPTLKFHPSNTFDPNRTSADPRKEPLNHGRTRWYVECWPAPVRRPLNNCFTFYSSPIITFTIHMTAYLLYLILYAAVMLFYYPTVETEGPMAWPEILLYVWQLTFFCEVCRSIIATPGNYFATKFYDWWHNGAFGTWNQMDCFSLALSLIAFIVRCCGVIPFSRLLMLIAMFLYFQRVYKIHFVSSYLGPKSVDLAMFLLVFVVFMLSYSISVQSLLHPRKAPYWGIGWDLFQLGIWETFGEPADETRRGHVENCNDTQLSFETGTLDCFLRVYPVPIFLAIYLFFGSILLVNMLIAVFAHVFDEVHANSKEIWRYQMYFLFNEFDEKPWLPAPLIVITHAWRVIKFIYRVCSESKPSTKIEINGRKISKNELKFLDIFERVCRRNVVDNLRLAERSKSNGDVNEPQDT